MGYGDVRKFEGEIYREISSRKTKSEAKLACTSQKTSGKKCRVVKKKDRYYIYTRE